MQLSSTILCVLALSASALAFAPQAAVRPASKVSFSVKKHVEAAAAAVAPVTPAHYPVSFFNKVSPAMTIAKTQPGPLEPSAQIIVRQTLFDAILPNAIAILADVVRNIEIPSIETVIDAPVLGKLDFKLADLKVQGFNVDGDRSFINLAEEYGTLAFAEISLSLSAEWSFRQKNFPHTNGAGSAVISLSRGNIAANARFDATDEGLIFLDIMESITQFAKIDIDTKGSALSWLINVISDIFSKNIRVALCNKINDVIKVDLPNTANKLFATQPLSVNIAKLFNLDLAFVHPIGIHPTNLDVRNHVLISTNDFSPCPYKSGISTRKHADSYDALSKMARIYIDQTAAQCALWALTEQVNLKATISQNDLPDNIVILNTDSWDELVPYIAETWPSRPMELDASIVNVPAVSVTRALGASVTAQAVLKFFVLEKSGARTPLFDLLANARISLDKIKILQSPDYKTNKIKLGLEGVEVESTILSSSIGEIDIDPIQETLDALASLAVGVIGNLIPEITLPEIPIVRLIAPIIEYSDNELVISSNFGVAK